MKILIYAAISLFSVVFFIFAVVAIFGGILTMYGLIKEKLGELRELK